MTERKTVKAFRVDNGKEELIWLDRLDVKYHTLAPVSAKEEVKDDVEYPFVCELCGKAVKTEAALKAHMTRFHKPE